MLLNALVLDILIAAYLRRRFTELVSQSENPG